MQKPEIESNSVITTEPMFPPYSKQNNKLKKHRKYRSRNNRNQQLQGVSAKSEDSKCLWHFKYQPKFSKSVSFVSIVLYIYKNGH